MSQTYGAFPYLRGVAYADGEYAAVGDGGAIIISSNAVTWTQISSLTTNSLHGIAGNSGWRTNGLPQFLAVGDSGTTIECSSGTNWTAVSSGTSNSLYAATLASSALFLIVGNGGTVIRLSTSGFSQRPQIFVGTTNNFYAVASAGNGAVAAAGELFPNPFTYPTISSNQILYSLNLGLTWKNYPWILDQYGDNPNLWYLSSYFIMTGMAYGANGFVSVGYTGLGLEYHPAVVMTSTTGTSWTEMPSSTSENALKGVTYGDGLYVAVGDFGSIVVSTNATNWTEIIPDRRGDILAIACNSNLWIASSLLAEYSWGFPDFSTLVSTNGTNWSVSTYNLSAMADLKCNGTQFVGVSANNIYTTIDGYNWQTNSSFTNTLYGVVNANGQFVVVGNNGSILRSSDGFSWEDDSVATTGTLRGIAYGNGLYVAAGSVAATSTDGKSWSLCPSNPPTLITRIVYGKGLFVATAPAGQILTSQDGTNWQVRFIFGQVISGIAYSGGTFVAIASYGIMFKSSDGITWIQLAQVLPPGLFEYYDMQDGPPYIPSESYTTVCNFNGTFLAAGGEGNILQSGNTWNPALINAPQATATGFTFSYNQQIDVPYRIQSSTNLVNWENVYSGVGSGQPTNFTYSASGSSSSQFFRIISP